VLTCDQYGRPRKDALVASGSGSLVSYPERLTARAYRDILDRLLDQAGAAGLVRIEGPHGEPVWGVNVRAVETDGRLLVKPAQRVAGAAAVAARDEALGQKRPQSHGRQGNRIPFTLVPLEPTLLALKLR